MADKEALQSKTIDFLRFPIALMVIFIHQNPVFMDSSEDAGAFLFNVLGSACSHVLAFTAVPLSFFISGYLYFYRVGDFGWDTYVAKTRRRFRSLILPYFYWNMIAFLAVIPIIIYGIQRGVRGVEYLWEYLGTFGFNTFWDARVWIDGWRCFGLLGNAHNSGPVNLPLWFVRNLIVLLLLSPVIHWLLKRWGRTVILVLGAAYLSSTWINYMPLSISGFFYFSLGSYLSINNRNISDCFGKQKILVGILALALAVLCVALDVAGHTRILAAFRPAFVLCGVITVYNIMHWLIETGRCTKQWPILLQASFFVFALHEIMLNKFAIDITYKTANMLITTAPALANLVAYFVSPLLVAAVCLLLFRCMQKMTPRLLRVLTGNR